MYMRFYLSVGVTCVCVCVCVHECVYVYGLMCTCAWLPPYSKLFAKVSAHNPIIDSSPAHTIVYHFS